MQFPELIKRNIFFCLIRKNYDILLTEGEKLSRSKGDKEAKCH